MKCVTFNSSNQLPKRMSRKSVENRKTSLDDMQNAIKQYYPDTNFDVNFPKLNIPVGNAKIDGEVVKENGFKIAVELKGPKDTDIVKGIGQLVEAGVHGYQQAILVVTEKRGRTIRKEVFEKTGIGLVVVSAQGKVKFLVQARDLNFEKKS